MKEFRACVVLFVLLTIVTGVAYPLVVTAVAQVAFADQANGSLIVREGKVIGSSLIGQSFTDPKYFWSRPSGTGPVPYNAAASSGSNLGPTNPALHEAVAARVEQLKKADPENDAPVPIDLVTASASGLDPHISPAAAEYQTARVARVRGLDVAAVKRLIAESTEARAFGTLGEARVNVLELNLALDALQANKP